MDGIVSILILYMHTTETGETVAVEIVGSFPDSIPSFSVLHVEKTGQEAWGRGLEKSLHFALKM